jgi:predicted O-methyltransferase YrrM
MTEQLWTDVDRYIDARVAPSDPVLDAVLESTQRGGLPAINVSPSQGKLLMVLARSIRARRVLEIGTLAGYSTIWLARAVADGGRVVTLEYDPKHADVARENFVRAGVSGRIDLRVGAALDTLPALADEMRGSGEPFDLVFIDADKVNTPEYFEWALRLTRVGSLIIVDNVVRDGKLADASSTDDSVRGMQRFMDMLARETRVVASAVQTVGSKGYDGFAIAVVEQL